ncbi:MAG: GNAT family N-acetyltransferase [Roseibium sp.]|uniref:GNAT family N-acetyltransferase n=1 Tax=Roseibium sp. TaxID=1936156 RepID=UPI00262E3D91|nr:GNAT family N-acetyltransferase [Roseibium sp.]MCV0429105.1 GNAT family N-acetyltransferase [Roseibium sp.]
MNIEIRQIHADEVAAFRQIRLEALKNEPSSYASSYEDWIILTTEDWQERLKEPVFVAFQAGEPVGIMGLLRQRASKMSHRATIVMVYVRENLRGNGIADKLLKAVVETSGERGIAQLELTVSAENMAAIEFYKRQGFTEVGRIPGGFLHQGREIDDLIMVYRLRKALLTEQIFD